MFRLVTGNRDSGKSSYLRELAGITGAAGFLSPKAFRAEGCSGYDILNLSSSERRPLARVVGVSGFSTEGAAATPGPKWFRFRRFYFDQTVFDWALITAREIVGAGRGPLILDELGPLEAEGRGLYEPLMLFLESGRELTVSCRPSLVERFLGLRKPDRVTTLIELAP